MLFECMCICAVLLIAIIEAIAIAIDKDDKGGIQRPINISYSIREYDNLETPEIWISLRGIYVEIPEIARVDIEDFSLISTVSVHVEKLAFINNEWTKTQEVDCTPLLTRWYQYVEFNSRSCFGLLIDDTFGGEYSVIVTTLNSTTTSEFQHIPLPQKYPWPLDNDGVWPPNQPNLCGNTHANYQSFGGQSTAYWHQGCDIRSYLLPDDIGQSVHSPCDGVVVQLVRYSSSDLYWSVMIEDEYGWIFQIHHMDIDTITVRIGDYVAQGEIVGRVAFWSSQHNGEYYHHIHLNVVRAHPSWTSIPNPYVDGWQYYDTFDFFDNGDFNNAGSPPFSSNDIFYYLENDDNEAFASSDDLQDVVLSDRVDIVINLGSLFQPTNSIPGHPYLNSPQEIHYTLASFSQSANVLHKETLMVMDRLPNGWYDCEPDFTEACSDNVLRRIYRQDFSYNDRNYQSVFNYNVRNLFYTITNTFMGAPNAPEGYLDTTRFANGRYNLTLFVSDTFAQQFVLSTDFYIEN